MKDRYLQGIYLRVIGAMMIMMMLFLGSIDYTIINLERKNHQAVNEARMEHELDEAASFLVEPLLKFRFADIEEFIQLSAANNHDIISYKAISPSGLILTEFNRASGSVFRISREKKIVFEGLYLLTLQLEKDYSDSEGRLIRMRDLFLAASLLVTFLFGVILWLIFKRLAIRPLTFEIDQRRRVEEELREINLQLEDKVLARTEEIDEKNKALRGEIRERKGVEQRLAGEKEQLAITLRSIGDGVITTDINGEIVSLNEAAEEITGWSQKEAVGRKLGEVFRITRGKGGKNLRNSLEIALESGRPVGFNNSVLITKTGRELSVANSGAPIRDAESHIVGGILIFRDIREMLRAEDELFKMKKLESVGILAGGIAHDFNNLLTAIIGNISLAGQLVDPDERIGQLLDGAEKASLRAKNLTHQLLTLAKGGEPLKETSAIDEVIRESADFVLRGDKIDYRLETDKELNFVDIDRGQVGQVVQNLLINACQAMPDGGTILISCTNLATLAAESPMPLLPEHNEYVKISVTDTGVGMTRGVAEKIFDPYFSTKQTGSGLGLAITHSIIRKHAGEITVNSEPGEGTTFTIYLPAVKDKKPIPESSEAMVELSINSRILFMDDDEMVRHIAIDMLTHLGCEVVTAPDGAGAVDLFKQARANAHPFDLVILDLTIPGGMGGEEAVIHVLKEDPAAKVVVASGYSINPVLANFQDYGFSAAIAKPFRLKDLAEVISSLL